MSVKKMADVWEYSRCGGVKLLLLLAIADHANDEGIAYPGITRLAKKIRRSHRYTRMVIQQVLKLRPRELVILESGGAGSRYDMGHLYQVVVKPHRNGLAAQLKADKAKKQRGEAGLLPSDKKYRGEAGLPPRGNQAAGEAGGMPPARGEAGLPQTTKEPSDNHQTTTTPAAAVDVGKGFWNWKVLGAATKLPKKSVETLTTSASQPAAFVALYLYGLSATGIKTPKLWASRQLIDDPAAQAGEPYDSLAQIGPARLAVLCGWMRDGGPLPELGSFMGVALAWRGAMNGKHKSPEALSVAADQVLNELGLSALVTRAEPMQSSEREPAPATAPLDSWQRMLANGLSREWNGPTLDRLRRCKLVADNETEGLVVGVANAQDYDWLILKVADRLNSAHRVTLVPLYR